jgi:hypothetical protein
LSSEADTRLLEGSCRLEQLGRTESLLSPTRQFHVDFDKLVSIFLHNTEVMKRNLHPSKLGEQEHCMQASHPGSAETTIADHLHVHRR